MPVQRKSRAPLTADQAAMVLEWREWAEKVGRQYARRCRAIDPDDAASDAVVGLMDAARDFNPARGVRFKTFALRRVVGAIVDSLRQLDFYPRGFSGRRAHFGRLVRENERGREFDLLGRPDNHPEVMETREEIELALARMPTREAAVVRLYYLDGLRMRDVGKTLGWSETRISQIMPRCLERFAHHLGQLRRA